MTDYLQNILTYFRNLTLNAVGVNRDVYRLIKDGDISRALDHFSNRDEDVDNALREYNPQLHPVMRRPDKPRKGARPHITEKLPRLRARYINKVELFFLLGQPIKWEKTDGDDEAYGLFVDFLRDQHFDDRMRQAKRLAGAETESAKLYHIYRDPRTDAVRVKSVVLARSTGYRLRPLIDQWGNMEAFAYGYTLKEGGSDVRHWDFQTPDFIANAYSAGMGWQVSVYPNPTGKINVIYYRQPKAWEGVEQRINREEELDSKLADENDYFADPIAVATADVINNMFDPDKPGKLIQLTGSGSSFGYINPPTSSAARAQEMQSLKESILFDTFTPDFDFEKMRGFGTLSGTAIKNAMVLGYMKRADNMEIYCELVEREKNLVMEILKLLHPEKARSLSELKVGFEFSEPFASDSRDQWGAVAQMYQAGLMSLETAVNAIGASETPDEEVRRIIESGAVEKEGVC